MKEIDRIAYLVEALIDRPGFVEKLDFFCEYEKKSRQAKSIQRWEGWLQLEIMHELHMKGVVDLWHEVRYSRDGRQKAPIGKHENDVYSLDVVYRWPGQAIDCFTGLELKVKDKPGLSIKGALVDLYRINGIIKSHWEFRAVYALSIFVADDNRKSKYIDLVEKFGRIINFGPYKAALLGWEANKLNGAGRSEYGEWVGVLRNYCERECDINIKWAK